MASDGEQALLDNVQVYDSEEIVYHRRLRLFDFGFLPVFAAWYYFLALCVQPDVLSMALASPTPGWVVVLQGLLAAGSIAIWLCEVMMPGPKKTEEFYQVLRYCGWYITLTRHCLTFQMIHLTVSFVATVADIPWLADVANSITLFIGSSGWFVTVQYYSLVHFNEAFVARCDRMISLGFVHYRRTNIIIHTPALFLAVLDTVLAKNRAVLTESCSVLANLGLCAFYVFFYMTLTALNNKATGFWPYKVLEDLRTCKDWSTFIAVQLSTFWFFCAIEWGLCFAPVAW